MVSCKLNFGTYHSQVKADELVNELIKLVSPTLLITGGTGSLGQAIVRYALKYYQFQSIRIYSRNEYFQWQMRNQFKDARLRFMLGDVRDRDRLAACLNGVDYVIHAAALKHLSLGQYNPQEFIKTNVLGSTNVVDLATQLGVKKVLGISSDKAVYPSALYGSTKQIMETLFLNANRWASPKTKFSILRSGNFFESRGNVFELWKQQAETGEITLTSEDMRRYFIPTDKVAELALKFLDIMQGQEVFIPKMQEYQLPQLLKELYPDIKVKITGKDEGEKIREELFREDEYPVDCGDYWVIK